MGAIEGIGAGPGHEGSGNNHRTDCDLARAHVALDRLLQRWISTAAACTTRGARTVTHLSAEFPMGPHLGNKLVNVGILDEVRQAVTELGLDFDDQEIVDETREQRVHWVPRRVVAGVSYDTPILG